MRGRGEKENEMGPVMGIEVKVDVFQEAWDRLFYIVVL
jgi:hypothetical protein